MNEFENVWEAIRKRPAMYVGSTGLFGFVNYMVAPVALMLAHGARHIHATVGDGFEVSSESVIQIERTASGVVAPFQEIRPVSHGHDFEATVLNALSQEFSVTVNTGAGAEEWRFSEGAFVGQKSVDAKSTPPGTVLRFKPDVTIFNATGLSPAAVASYFRRLSYLHQGVRFSLTVGGSTQEFCHPNGLTALFTAIAAPYQIMHEPIHITMFENRLDLEIVMAYQSWKDDHIWFYINNGRAVLGGTHEQGLNEALRRVKKKLNLPEHFNNGVVAVASLHYPDAVWEGCVKARIGNPELRTMVARLVTREVIRWMEEHPDVQDHVKQLETFQFPEAWYDKG